MGREFDVGEAPDGVFFGHMSEMNRQPKLKLEIVESEPVQLVEKEDATTISATGIGHTILELFEQTRRE